VKLNLIHGLQVQSQIGLVSRKCGEGMVKIVIILVCFVLVVIGIGIASGESGVPVPMSEPAFDNYNEEEKLEMTEEEFREFIDWAIDEAERYGYRKAVENRPQGEWIRTPFTDCGSPIDECSNCGHHINGDVKVRNYCPNCGWRMKG